MRKIFFMLLSVTLLSSSLIHSQTKPSLDEDSLSTHGSRLSIYSSWGALELLANGVQFMVADHFAIGLKYSTYIISGKGFIFPLAGSGPGVSLTYFTNTENLFNNYNGEVSYMVWTSHENVPHGIGAQITTGHKNYNKGFHVFWSLGVSASITQNTPDLFLPSIKIGMNYNF